MIDISTIISVVAGILLSISESLPFITSLESQGIVHFLVNIGQNFLSTNNNNTEVLQPLLDHEHQHQINPQTVTVNTDININKISNNINNINDTLKDVSLDFKTARQLKLQTSQLYQLNYIINYIKQNYIKRQLLFKNLFKNNKELLISEGYSINYDSKDDISVISW